MQTNKNHIRGYVALISTLVVSAILMVSAITIGLQGFLSKQNTNDSEDYISAKLISYSCAYSALFSLAQDYSYSVPAEGVLVFITDTQTCRVEDITANGNEKVIRTSAQVRNARAETAVHIKNSTSPHIPFIILDWER
jgi:hypothetical protein